MTDPTIPTMDEMVEMACAACAEAGFPVWREEIAISLAAALPLVTMPAIEALGALVNSLAEQDDEGLIEHAEPFRRAVAVRDQVAALYDSEPLSRRAIVQLIVLWAAERSDAFHDREEEEVIVRKIREYCDAYDRLRSAPT